MVAEVLERSQQNLANDQCSRSCAEANPRLARRCCCQCHGRNHGKGVYVADALAEAGQ